MIRRRRNLDGYMEGGVFHPIRGSEGYDDERLGDTGFSFGANDPAERKKAERAEAQGARERQRAEARDAREKRKGEEWEEKQREKESAASKRAWRRGRHTFTGAGEDDYTGEGLAHFVRRHGGIRIKKGDAFFGEVDGTLSQRETGTTGLIRRVDPTSGLRRAADIRGGLSPEYMRDAAVVDRLIPEDASISDFLMAVEKSVALEQKGGKRRNTSGAYYEVEGLLPRTFKTLAAATRAAKQAQKKGAPKLAIYRIQAYEPATRMNPKQKRKPLAREFGESDTGTQPRLFIMGDKKHAGQETMEELFAEGEKMPAKKKANPGLQRVRRLKRAARKVPPPKDFIEAFTPQPRILRALAAEKKMALKALAKKGMVDRAGKFSSPRQSALVPQGKLKKKRNFKISAAGKLRIGKNPKQKKPYYSVSAFDAQGKHIKKEFKSQPPANAWARKHDGVVRLISGDHQLLTTYRPNPPSGYTRDKQEERAYKLLQKAAHRSIHAKTPAGKKKAEKALAAAQKTFDRAQAAAVTRRRVGVGLDKPKRRRNVSIKVGGRSKFRATKKGVTIGGRVTLRANPNFRDIEKFSALSAKHHKLVISGPAKDRAKHAKLRDEYNAKAARLFAEWEGKRKTASKNPTRAQRVLASKKHRTGAGALRKRAQIGSLLKRKTERDKRRGIAGIHSHEKRKGWARARRADIVSGRAYDVVSKTGTLRHQLNPSLFETFHGRRATKENVLNAPDGTPKRLDKLGKLVSLHAEGGTIKPRATVWLCADSRGKLHLCTSASRLIDGGPQNFGQVKKIEYETTKNHLDGKPTIYYHHFGEEGGSRPTLHSDGRGGLKLKGGAYKIRAEGIRN